MAPTFPETKITLDYPLYGCDFDPQDANRLFVAGGGGASRTGVNNKITLLDATSREKLEHAGELVLSKNEDNPATLIAGPRKGKATLLWAGVNASPDDIEKGNNAHFRVFAADPLPPKAKSVMGARISELHRSSLFTTVDKEAYQRLLRVTQPFPGAPQFGAVATGTAKQSQIALFEVGAGKDVAPKPKGVLDLSKEAVDLDVIQTEKEKYQLMYCDNYNIYALDVIGGNVKDEPKCIYAMPDEGGKPSFRCIRYISPVFAIAVANLPSPGGVVIYGIRLPKAGKADSTARISVNTTLPKQRGVKATGLAVANLSPISEIGATQGDSQFVIAIVNNDSSIHLYNLDHVVMGEVELLANLFPLQVLKGVHPMMITNLAFSHFTPPSKTAAIRIQHLKLASTSASNSVVVHHIPLKKFYDKAGKVRRGGPPRQSRYVTVLQARGPSPTRLFLGFALAFLVMSIIVQGLLEVRGLAQPTVGGHKWLPSIIHAVPASPLTPNAGFLARLIEKGNLGQHKDGIVLLDSEVPGELRVDTTHDGSARRWEDLAPDQQALWKQRLQQTGHWVEDMGTVVFKSILFGEIAGVVAGVVGG